jgi:microcystin-dependent protein
MMNDHLEKLCEELRAELGALHKRLEELESKQASSKGGAYFKTRRVFSGRRVAASLSAAILLVAGGILYGQGAGDALFIDPSGRVGIGTANPLGKLDIQGGADSNGGSDPQALSLSYRNGGYRHWIRTRHNGTIGSGNAIDFFVNNSTTADGSKAPGAGSLHVMTLDSGQVGIGTGTAVPTAKLEVNGRIKDQSGYVMPVGSVLAYQGEKAPDGWLLCDGGSIPKDAKYQDLRTLLQKDTTPDLRGRTLIGAGQGTGLTARGLGQQGGEENHRLTVAEMPSHNHHGFGEAYDPYWPFGRVGPKNQKGSRGGVDEDNYYYNTSTTGGNSPFNNMQPYHVVNYIIKY